MPMPLFICRKVKMPQVKPIKRESELTYVHTAPDAFQNCQDKIAYYMSNSAIQTNEIGISPQP